MPSLKRSRAAELSILLREPYAKPFSRQTKGRIDEREGCLDPRSLFLRSAWIAKRHENRDSRRMAHGADAAFPRTNGPDFLRSNDQIPA